MAEQGTTYFKFIERHADAEYARRATLDARGLGIVTSNGAFTSLVFGLLVIIEGKANLDLVIGAKWALGLALGFLVASSAYGLYATQLFKFTVTSAATLEELLGSPRWKDDEIDARNVCATSTAKTVSTLRAGNDKKATRVVVAVGLQILAIACIAAGVGAELIWD